MPLIRNYYMYNGKSTSKINNNLCYNCITNSLKVPKPLDSELATIFNRDCFYPIDSFCDRIKRKEDENGIS